MVILQLASIFSFVLGRFLLKSLKGLKVKWSSPYKELTRTLSIWELSFILGLTSLSTYFKSYRDGVVTEDMRTTLYCSPSEISHHMHICMISRPATLFWQQVNELLRWNTFCISIWEGSNYQFEIFGLTRPRIEPWTSRTWIECSTTRLLVLVEHRLNPAVNNSLLCICCM